MKKTPILALLLALLSGFAVTSCDLTSDSDYVYDRDCIISAVTLGTIPRTLHTIGSAGQDSTYQVSITGSNYPMKIDHLNSRIYNADSLPVGTHADKVVFSTFTNSGTTSIKSLTTGNDTIFTSTDSTDFSQPREITVYAEDGVSRKTYTVEVRVHKEEADTFRWHSIAEGGQLAFNSFVEMRALSLEGQLYLFGQDREGGTQVIATSTSAPDFTTARPMATTVDVRTVQAFKGRFFALSGGQVVTTADPSGPWSVASGETDVFDNLLAASSDSLYATFGGEMFSSSDGATWQPSAADKDASLVLLNSSAAVAPSRTDKNFETLVLVGKDATTSKPAVWMKQVDRTGTYNFPWTSLPQTEELGALALPDLKYNNLVGYDDCVVLIGATQIGGLESLYLSRDNGRTWDPDVLKPFSLFGLSAVAATVDKDSNIWIFTAGNPHVFKGRHNRLGWAE